MADYGYLRKGAIAIVRQRLQQGTEITVEDLKAMALTTVDLVVEAKRFISDPAIDSYKRRNLERNFLHFDGLLYLYSYTSQEFLRFLEANKTRANRTNAVLPDCRVIAIDTRYEFYDNEEFDWPKEPSKHDARFYAHLVTGLIDHYVAKELLDRLLLDTKRLGYLRLKRTAASIALIMALVSALAASTNWIWARVMQTADTTQALISALVLIAWVFGLTFLLALAFERIMVRLLPEKEQDGDGPQGD
jgi:hypothetical protein